MESSTMPSHAVAAGHGSRVARQHGALEHTDPPTDLDAVRLYRLDRLRSEMRRRDIAGLLLFDQINTRYATDATNMQVWSSHYETRCVFVALDGPVVLFDYADHPHLAEGLPTVDEYRVMPSFYYFTAGPHAEEQARRFADQIADLMRRHGGATVGSPSTGCRISAPTRCAPRGCGCSTACRSPSMPGRSSRRERSR
jgi:Xaa-Pro dipeptidase